MKVQRNAALLGVMIGAVLSLIFLLGFVSGAAFGQHRQSAADGTSDRNLNDFLTAYRLVTQHSYYHLNKQHLVYAAIDGMLSATGDPHTLFLSRRDNQVADQQINGSRFSGIGAIVAPAHQSLEIVAPLPHTPASEAGIHAGDRVIRIDGQPVSRMSSDVAIARIHGRAGTHVRLTLVRSNRQPFTVTVRRAQIPAVTAYGRVLPDSLGYIQIMSFGDNTTQELDQALSTVVRGHARGIILDLRGNPGGFVDAAQAVVSRFLNRGVVAYEKGPGTSLTPLRVEHAPYVTHLPLVILVDSGTASAAEITAGALRDDHRAVLIGTRTYGKGSMQSIYALTDGSSLRITDRMWLTPNKHSIQRVGIRPDLLVAVTPAQYQSGTDPQLAAAERYLSQHPGR